MQPENRSAARLRSLRGYTSAKKPLSHHGRPFRQWVRLAIGECQGGRLVDCHEMFEYDIFLSFSAKDVSVVKPIWQRLMSSGLRVFWSDENLKIVLGQSFVSGIQN